jgi:hypothetical protein
VAKPERLLPDLADRIATLDRGYIVDAQGLRIDQPGTITKVKWQQIGRELIRSYDRDRWALGDWILAHRGEWGDMYTLVMEITGFDRAKSSRLASVAQAFPRGRRDIARVSYSHFALVSSQPVETRIALLKKAELNRLSYSQFQEIVRTVNVDKRTPDQQLLVDNRSQRRVETVKAEPALVKCPNCEHVFQPKAHRYIKGEK